MGGHGLDPTAYTLDSDGTPHWERDGFSYFILQALFGMIQGEMSGVTQPSCRHPACPEALRDAHEEQRHLGARGRLLERRLPDLPQGGLPREAVQQVTSDNIHGEGRKGQVVTTNNVIIIRSGLGMQ